ncbi:hypothetical protein KUV26_11300 [Leisingera daeponensis]|uniref:DUF5673 domain-containing protein n=1 Tax=Leisingera daeponensis TaxID=405746 RepID=A0ABS7NFN1_9RHOB|nr:hypothetical protein [Leisingera daeponensis]MBY6140024.1 hypothetical protein [Leisingera daeponensis]
MKRLLWAIAILLFGVLAVTGLVLLMRQGVIPRWGKPVATLLAIPLIAFPLCNFLFTWMDAGRTQSRQGSRGSREAKFKIGFRIFMLLGGSALGILFIVIGFGFPRGLWEGLFQFGAIAFGVAMLYYTVVSQFWVCRWNSAYLDCPNRLGWPRLHEWSKVEAVSNFSEGMEWHLMFSETGKACIPYFLEGCDELVALAKEKLNDA